MREVLNNFDFNRVHEVMGFIGMKYTFGEGNDRVPTVKDLRKHAAVMMMFLARANGGSHHLEAGGFTVNIYHTSEGDKMSLEFVLESFESKPTQ